MIKHGYIKVQGTSGFHPFEMSSIAFDKFILVITISRLGNKGLLCINSQYYKYVHCNFVTLHVFLTTCITDSR